MIKYIVAFTVAAGLAFGQYKMEPAGAPPSSLASAFSSLLQPQGVKIMNASGEEYCEVWFVKTPPSGPQSTEMNVDFPTFPQGALLGVISFAGNAADRRGQPLKPGVYTMRYSLYPNNGDHQGVSPNRDFAVLTPAADDTDPASKPDFDALMKMSRKASGTPHPAVLSIWKSSATEFPSFEKQGDHDWVLSIKLGDVLVSIIVEGKSEV